ncbi:hypothetical protein BJ742DRAFT_775563 [Cladochytrium replicatum]|nr:hypothetical protein BJ742DRAFT_775563 [Cladochytrium replicatum]
MRAHFLYLLTVLAVVHVSGFPTRYSDTASASRDLVKLFNFRGGIQDLPAANVRNFMPRRSTDDVAVGEEEDRYEDNEDYPAAQSTSTEGYNDDFDDRRDDDDLELIDEGGDPEDDD